MKIALVGYGKMGRSIERLAPEYGCDVALRLDVNNNADFEGMTAESFRGIDAAVEFSTPATAVPHIEKLAALGVNVVVGTTGWLKDIERARTAVKNGGTALVWGANFSVGVNLFAQIVEEAARRFARERDYEAWAWEIHHSAKKDAPSGTLLALVDRMKKSGYDRAIDAGSNRAGTIPGTHEIGFDSADDTITLRHAARGRDGFSRGALRAAKWIIGKTGVYEFRDILNEL